MIRSKTMHLSNAKFMNDQLEFQNGDATIWRDLFFSCFMMEDDESIGMWGMYAQPWRDGVKITIPRDILRQWISETTEIIEVSQQTKKPTGRIINDPKEFKIWISAVAYSNFDGIDTKKEEEILRCGGQTNHSLHNVPHRAELTDYVIDSLVITPSPLFEGDIVKRIESEVSRIIATDNSKFVGKLQIRSACDSCSIAGKS